MNYTNQVQIDSAGNTIDVAVPVYKTVTACSNIANLSFNKAPDIIVKVAFDPKFGHYEMLGIGRFAHETVYPGETTDSNLYGGLKDIVTGAERSTRARPRPARIPTTSSWAASAASFRFLSDDNKIIVGGQGPVWTWPGTLRQLDPRLT